MKEIKIVFNKDEEILSKNIKAAISLYIDGQEVKNVENVLIRAHQPDEDITDEHGIVRLDDLVSYTVEYREPWSE